MSLHRYGTETVALMKWAAGTHFQQPHSWDGEEIFVLDGAFSDELCTYPKGSWIRNPSGSLHMPFTQSGCLLYIKTGHLQADK
jgi:anti-sigma factor ChrR (cupin superfamily)